MHEEQNEERLEICEQGGYGSPRVWKGREEPDPARPSRFKCYAKCRGSHWKILSRTEMIPSVF